MPIVAREVQRQPQELGVAGDQRVVVGGAGDEVVGEVGAASRAIALMSSIARLSSWKVNPPILRTMLAISWLAASESGWPSDQAGAVLGALLHAEEAVGVQAQRRRCRGRPSACSASPITSRMPANDGSSQLIDGWPSLK